MGFLPCFRNLALYHDLLSRSFPDLRGADPSCLRRLLSRSRWHEIDPGGMRFLVEISGRRVSLSRVGEKISQS